MENILATKKTPENEVNENTKNKDAEPVNTSDTAESNRDTCAGRK
jgi:hypothetical protein